MNKTSELISKRIAELEDWRGETLARLRKLIKAADPDAHLERQRGAADACVSRNDASAPAGWTSGSRRTVPTGAASSSTAATSIHRADDAASDEGVGIFVVHQLEGRNLRFDMKRGSRLLVSPIAGRS